MWNRLTSLLPSAASIFNKSTAVKTLAVAGAGGLAYSLLNPRPSEPVLPAEIPPTPEMLGAQAAVQDFSAQMEAMAASRMNPAFNPAGFQVSGAELAGRVGSPELAMGATGR